MTSQSNRRRLRHWRAVGLLFGLALWGAAGASTLYLPLNAPIATDAERLAVVSRLGMTTKPYPIAPLREEAERLRGRYPALSARILTYLDRYYPQSGTATSTGFEARVGTKATENVPNAYGDTTANGLVLRGSGSYSGAIFKSAVAVRALVDHGGVVGRPEQAYVSFGSDAMQVDLGMRGHWTAPGLLDSPLASNTPETYPSITVSNSRAFHFGGLRYEIFLGQLSGHDTIMLGNVASPGRPLLASTHVTFTIGDAVEFGATRDFIFGGGQRTVNFSDFLAAFFNPVGKDNVGHGCSGTSPNCEFGDQIMMLTGSLKLDDGGTPFQVYTHLGAEDSEHASPTQFGNVVMTMGLYLPWLTQADQLTVEYSDFQPGWMIHHIYRDGATNNGRVIGPWWADLQGTLLGNPGSAAAVRWVHDAADGGRVDLIVRGLNVDTATGIHQGYQVQTAWSESRGPAAVSYGLIFGERVDTTRFLQLRVGYDY